MPLKKSALKTIIILSSLAIVVVIGIATGVITFQPPEDSKNLNRAQKKSDECFQKLKLKFDNKKLMPSPQRRNGINLGVIFCERKRIPL